MAPTRTGARRRPAGKGIRIAIAIASLLPVAWVAAPASAATGGAVSPGGGPPPAASPTGTPAAGGPSSGELTIVSAKTTPKRSFYYGSHYPRLAYVIGSTQAQNDLQINVVSTSGAVVKTYYRNDVAPNTTNYLRWDGSGLNGRPAPNGQYHFEIGPQGGEPLAQRSQATEPQGFDFSFYRFAFPVLGPHDFGGASARFGAPRAGHTHQGQDIMANCGEPIVAARGGTVRYAGYEANAGNYLVIDGKGTGLDMVYMHLLEPSVLKAGMPVRTGQPIGLVGQTGDATACHLHFEIWTAPGWYQGGSPIDPLPYLQRWDLYS